VLTKSIGSANPHNVVRATFAGLKDLRDPSAVRKLRGKDDDEESGRPVNG
jgi:small subunit ribosomal protein S5